MEEKMPQLHNGKMLFLVSIIALLYAFTFMIGNKWLIQMAEPLLLFPLLFLFIDRYLKANFVLSGFLILVTLATLFRIFDLRLLGFKIEFLAYALSYLCLIFESVRRIGKLKISKIVGAYLFVVFMLNTYLLYVLYDTILQVSINNTAEVFLVAFRIVFLLFFSLFSFVFFLGSESKKSVLLLLMSLSLIFSDIFFLVSEYYLYFWLFDLLSKILYLSTLYCFYLYVNCNSVAFETDFKEVLA